MNHDNVDWVHFVVDYFPVDPMFAYFIMCLYTKYDLSALLNDKNLVGSVFKEI